jgi:hypothetical protein
MAMASATSAPDRPSDAAASPTTPATPGGRWSDWTNLSKTLQQLVPIRHADGTLEVFGVGPDGVAWYDRQTTPGGPWGGWQGLGGQFTQLDVAHTVAGVVELVAVGADAVWYNLRIGPGGAWGDWSKIGTGGKQVAAVRNADGTLEAIRVGPDNAVSHSRQASPGGAFGGWTPLGGDVQQVVATRQADGILAVFAISSNHAVGQIRQTTPGGPWGSWSGLGGWATQLTLEHERDGRISLFGIGSDQAVLQNRQVAPGGAFGDWQSLGGQYQQIATGRDDRGRLEVIGIGMDDAVWENRQTSPGGVWAGWNSLGGKARRVAAPKRADGWTGTITPGPQTGTGKPQARSVYATTVLADRPVGYWRLGEAPGQTTARDSSPSGHHGTYADAVTRGVPGALAADPDTAARFDGTGAVDFSGCPYNFINDFTLEAWVTNDHVGTGCGRIFSSRSGPKVGYGLGMVSSGNLRFTTFGIKDHDSTVTLPKDGKSHHVVLAFDPGNRAHFYLDGELLQTIAGPSPANAPSTGFSIGRNPGSSAAESWYGRIDEAAIYKGVLSAERIKAHYQAGTNPQVAGAGGPPGPGGLQQPVTGGPPSLDEPFVSPPPVSVISSQGLTAQGTVKDLRIGQPGTGEPPGTGGPQPTGTGAGTRPDGGKLELFVIGQDDALWQNTQAAPGGPWSGWTSLSGKLLQLVPVRHADGTLEVYSVRTGGTGSWRNRQTAPGGPWGGWNNLGGVLSQTAQLAVEHDAKGRAELLLRVGKSVHYSKETTPGVKGSFWTPIGTGGFEQIVVARHTDRTLEVFGLKPDQTVAHSRQLNPRGEFGPWSHLREGTFQRLAAAVRHPHSTLEVWALGTDGAAWHIRHTTPGGSWGSWSSLGGQFQQLAVEQDADGRVDLLAIGTDDAVWHNRQAAPGEAFGGWQSLGNQVRQIATGRDAEGRLAVFGVGRDDSAVCENRQTIPDGAWAGWSNLGISAKQVAPARDAGPGPGVAAATQVPVMQFDGKASYIELTPPPTSIGDGTAITVEFWANGAYEPDLKSRRNGVILGADGVSPADRERLPQRMLRISLVDNRNFVIWVAGHDDKEDDVMNVESKRQEYLELWVHWAFVKDVATATMIIYRNGAVWRESSAGASRPLQPIEKFTIGRDPSQDYFWGGRLAEFRLWAQARTPEEIRADMGRRLTGQESGLVGCWPLNQVDAQEMTPDLTGQHPGKVYGASVVDDDELRLP